VRIGAERAKTSYAWKQFLDNGVPLAFGTDYPVEPITPFRGIYAAVTRKNKGTLAPGMLADFVVLDRDLTKIAPPEILKTRVLRTVVGGKTVYESDR